MAKQAVGTIERHLEKGILGVAVLVLFVAVGKFLIISPNKVELVGADTVTPGTVDDKVAEGAEAVRRTIAAAKPVQKPVESAAPEFDKRLDPYQFASLPLDLPRGVAFQPPVPVFSTVVAVNVLTRQPQTKSTGTRRGRITGRISGWRKAIITLAPGQKIQFFEGV